MFDRIFTSNTNEKSTSLRLRKGVMIGLGQVGLACTYSLLIQDCFDILVLQDRDPQETEGEAMDLAHGIPFIAPTEIVVGTVADAGKDADVVIITAGASHEPGESRLDVVDSNVAIFQDILGDVARYCPNAIILVVTNPVDIMTYVTLKITGFPQERVIGSGTVLDSSRLRSLLASRLNVDPRSVHAYIIGEHGDSEVAVWSKTNVAGQKLLDRDWDDLTQSDRDELTAIYEEVKNAGYNIIQLKGYTSYAIGLAVTDIVKSIIRSQERILTVSSLVEEMYGISDVCLSLPRVVNEQGILKTVNLNLSSLEEKQLRHSAEVLKEVIDGLSL